MSLDVFMRGRLDLTLSIGYFLGARTSDGTTYIYYPVIPDPPSRDRVVAVTPPTYGVFASIKYDVSQASPKVVYIRVDDKDKSKYSLKSDLSNGGSNSFFTLKTFGGQKDVLSVSDDAKDVTTEITFKPVTDNLDPKTLWAGVWYKAFSGVTPLRWKMLAPANKPGGGTHFLDATGNPIASPTNFEIMFIPKGDGNGNGVGVWHDNQCTTPVQTTASADAFSAWIDGDPGAPLGCRPDSWLIGDKAIKGAQGCLFTSEDECNKGYLYSYCTGTDKCGKCIGPCSAKALAIAGDPSDNNPDNICLFDFDPSIQKAGTSPLTCDPKDPTPKTFWERYGTIIIILIIVFIIISIIVFIIIYKVYEGSKNKNS